MAYAIPYHASLLFDNYNIGFGILSLQAKESKHSGIKHDLLLTNRSRSTGSLGKWLQVMTVNYVRAFYLPERYPMPSMYISHYESRMPPQVSKPNFFQCGREKSDPEEQLCTVLECAAKPEHVQMALESLKPVVCPLCSEGFADMQSCDTHYKVIHTKGIQRSQHLHAKELSVAELKEELRKRGLNTTRNKSILSRRMEGCLAGET